MTTDKYQPHNYEDTLKILSKNPEKWLITGVAGFIGSNLLETLLKHDQHVVGLDNFSTGHKSNLYNVKHNVSGKQWSKFTLIKGDIRNLKACKKACNHANYVLHQAALCSVEQSIQDPILTSTNNIDGFLNMIMAAHEAGVDKFVYASSCAVYGNCTELPLDENKKGNLLSPYAADKYINELHGDLFSKLYNVKTIGLRYFNVFGPRQNPNSEYSGVIAKWFSALIKNDNVYIYGDGKTSRDFCYIEDCIQANILAAYTKNPDVFNAVYNVGSGKQTDLNHLFESIKKSTAKLKSDINNIKPDYKEFRPGDIRHSVSNIVKTNNLLGYRPKFSLDQGLDKTASWYFNLLK